MEDTPEDAFTIAWITDYLTNTLFMRLNGYVSDLVLAGAPQGTVLSSLFFTLYTSDFQHKSESCHLQKYSDVGCITGGHESEYRGLVDSHLVLNVNKGGRQRRLQILGEPRISWTVFPTREKKWRWWENINSSVFTCTTDWTGGATLMFLKGQSRLYIFRKLRSFSVWHKILHIFSRSAVNLSA